MAAQPMFRFTLNKKPVVSSYGGCGVQLNQHALAPVSLDFLPTKPAVDSPAFNALKADMEAKIRALAPHIVRIFFNEDHEGVPLDPSQPKSAVNKAQGPEQKTRWASFVETVRIADSAGAKINVTWHGGSLADGVRATKMERFANVLDHLVKSGRTNLQWATIRNEPNTNGSKLTPKQLGDAYKLLDGFLVARGIRSQVRLMGGDLQEGSTKVGNPINQERWFREFAQNMPNVAFDSISTHIYWPYDTTGRFEKRLNDVLNILNRFSAKKGDGKTLHYNMPVYVTEFGPRSADFKHPGVIDPGNYHGPKTKQNPSGLIPMYKTTIAPFQAAWFQLRALELGYAGLIKWDCQFGIYDVKEKTVRAYHALSRPDPKKPTVWQVWPMYHLLRLFTLTTELGWKVFTYNGPPGGGRKHVVAFKSPGTAMTVIGLSEEGGHENAAPAAPLSYEIDGLTKNARYRLLIWNKGGRGGLVLEPAPVVANANGHAIVKNIPKRAVFALTSKELPSDLGG